MLTFLGWSFDLCLHIHRDKGFTPSCGLSYSRTALLTDVKSKFVPHHLSPFGLGLLSIDRKNFVSSNSEAVYLLIISA